MILSECVKILNSVNLFLKEYRTSFGQIICKAKEIANKLEINADFQSSLSIRIRRKSKLFIYEGTDKLIENPSKKFKVVVFNYLLDICTNSITEKFTQLENHMKIFEFL